MPLIDVSCRECGTVSEVFRHHSDHPATPSCPKCDGSTEQIHLPWAARATAPAVVVYQAPDGTFRFPGESDGSGTKKYDRLGYTRVEARGWAEVRELEKRLNTQQASEMHKRVEKQQAQSEAEHSARRKEVFAGMTNSFSVPEVATDSKGNQHYTGRIKSVTLSPEARDLMRAAMANNDRKERPRHTDPGGYFEVYSQDRSNRDESRDGRGMRRRD